MKNASQRGYGILGAGSWGTAVALYLARQGHRVQLWSRSKEHAATLRRDCENKRYLAGHRFPDFLEVSHDLQQVLHDCQIIIVAVPSHAWIACLEQCVPYWSAEKSLVWLTKGFSSDPSEPFLHRSALQLLGKNTPRAMISGPSFAQEVAQGQPTALLITSDHAVLQQCLVQAFSSRRLRVYTSQDWVGVQCCAVMKNVLAVAAGVVDGLGLGANTTSALITRGMAETVRLTQALGGQSKTCLGLAGLGDILLSCTDNQSRNRRLGLALGRGETIANAQAEIGAAIESVRNVTQLCDLARDAGVALPICEQVHALLTEQVNAEEARDALLERHQNKGGLEIMESPI